MDTTQPVTGVVLGNGPSKHHFDRVGDIVIGCNIPSDEFSVDATIITDVEVIWVLKNNPDLITCPVIVSSPAYEKMKELRIEDQFTIQHVFKTRDWYTSGHYAALYLTNIIRCDKIYIWGCDSYLLNTTKSTTDDIIPKTGEPFYKQWRRSWKEVFDSHPHVQYIVKVL